MQFYSIYAGNRTYMKVSYLGPMEGALNTAREELKLLGDTNTKHWMCKGKKSLAIAATLLRHNKIIAVPTDTIYGLACIASETSSVKKLYEIKGRNENKPLSICIGNVNDINTWAVVNHLPRSLLLQLLPGPFTIILKRTPDLNPSLNPDIDTVGIRIPRLKFLNCLSQVVGPLALTSANISNEPSCLTVTEFEKLWPELGGIFHIENTPLKNYRRAGSTIVDLSCPSHYKIVRSGVGERFLIQTLEKFSIKPYVSN